MIGCSVCAFSMGDFYLPPIGAWILFSVAWFLSVVFVADRIEGRPRWIPRVRGAVILLAGLLLLSIPMFGPFPFLLLLPLSLIATIALVLVARRSPLGSGGARRFWPQLVALGLCGAVLCAAMVIERSSRTAESYLRRWPMGFGATLIAREEAERNPPRPEALRALLRSRHPGVVRIAAERLVSVEEAWAGPPLLRRTMEEAASRDDLLIAQAIERVLRANDQAVQPENEGESP